MTRSRFTDQKIIGVLRKAEAGAKVPDLRRRNGISEAAYYTRKARYSSIDVSQLRGLKELQVIRRLLELGTSMAALGTVTDIGEPHR